MLPIVWTDGQTGQPTDTAFFRDASGENRSLARSFIRPLTRTTTLRSAPLRKCAERIDCLLVFENAA